MADGIPELIERLRQMPQAMRERKQWLLWRLEKYDGDKKPRKVPYYCSGRKRRGGQGSVEDRAELVVLEVAIGELQRGHYTGAGFAFLPGDGLIGIDIDGAIDADTGEVSERCQAIVEACGSYTEYSPSGRGVHIICAGETKTFKDNAVGLEVFCGSQFFTCTGRRWPGTPGTVEPIGEKTLARLQATVRAGKTKRPAPAVAGAPLPVDDFKRINAMALASLDSWVPQLFPTAKRSALGYRIAQQDLGRELQEDLSITPQGIRDFGVADMGDAKAGGRTAIDLVVEWRGLEPKDALHWLAGCLGVVLKRTGKAKTSPADGAPTPTSGCADESEEGEDWRDELLRERGGKKDCRENVYLYLTHHRRLKGLVGYDEFAHRVMKLVAPPWKSTPGEWTTTDDYFLAMWLAKHERLVVRGEATLVAGVAMAAFENRFHPVREYLAGLAPWDRIERLAHWLHECLGAESSDYTRLVGTWFLMGMVKRVLDPGCQMDYMVVLEGIQGKRKSTALRTLVGNDEWFADTPIRIGDKDAMLSLAGKWLYEVGELDSFNKAEVTAVKQYVSSRIDRVREPFARRPSDRPRSGVFAGSTNQSEYFKDPTGARRFWPVACDGTIDVEKLSAWRDQLFAEAQARLRHVDPEMRRYYPTREETEKYLVPQQERREIVDPWFERLAVWLDSKAPYADMGLEVREVDCFTAQDLLTRCLSVPLDRIDGGRQMATRVGIAMHKLKWEKRRDPDGARLYRYWRPGTTSTAGGPAALAEALHEF